MAGSLRYGLRVLTGPLANDLDTQQRALLEAIWEPVTTQVSDDGVGWAIWNYVSRAAQVAGIPDAGAVWKSLPTIPRAIGASRYGLAWREEHGGDIPNRDERVGLTLAGLVRISDVYPGRRVLADQIVGLIAVLAAREAALPAKRTISTNGNEQLTVLANHLAQRTLSRPFDVPVYVMGAIMRFEICNFANSSSMDGEYAAGFGWGLFERFIGTVDVDDYLARAIALSAELVPVVKHRAPLPLIQTMDYASLTLKVDEMWLGSRLITSPDLGSAAALVMSVSNQAEFESRIAALWTILNAMNVPILGAPVEQHWLGRRASGSMDRLEVWLLQRVDPEVDRVRMAIQTLRDVRELRNEAAHQDDKSRTRAMQARRNLGLPDYLTNWAVAWQVVTLETAAAFDIIRQEIQGAPAGRHD